MFWGLLTTVVMVSSVQLEFSEPFKSITFGDASSYTSSYKQILAYLIPIAEIEHSLAWIIWFFNTAFDNRSGGLHTLLHSFL